MDDQLGDYTFLTAVSRGWGLAIRCRGCGRYRRLSDKTLAARFRNQLSEPVSSVRNKLVCSCGERDYAMSYYHPALREPASNAALPAATAPDGLVCAEARLPAPLDTG